MFKNLFAKNKQPDVEEVAEERKGEKELDEIISDNLKGSELPEQIALDLSHNPFAPNLPQEELPKESQLLFLDKSDKQINSSESLAFVQIDSYESLRSRVGQLTTTLRTVKTCLHEKDLACQQTEEEVSAASRTICGLRQDIRELVARVERQQCDMEELKLERQGYNEVNNALH